VSEEKTRIMTAVEKARAAGPTENDGGRTRVLAAEQAARLIEQPGGDRPPAEPRLVDGKIVFFCANGHRIIVDRALAGKRGNCSKQGCGTPVVIPFPPGLEPRPAIGPAAEPAAASEAGAAEAPAIAVAVEPGMPAVVTESPGAAGQEALPSLDFTAAPVDAAQPDAPDSPGFDQAAPAEGWGIDLDAIDHPTARLVARLWVERAHGGVVEIHLTGGSVIMPEWYDPRWSCGSHALFAALAADGSVTLTAVAWDQIQKVVVRQVQGTPEGMFEG
jgi:hypothetical protein